MVLKPQLTKLLSKTRNKQFIKFNELSQTIVFIGHPHTDNNVALTFSDFNVTLLPT
jgi:hypothetical protein